ncbi:MAG: sigma-70 family RNA polymerase sigma factor [Firmicutes bacterium]|nr:sigma-70 family RNA polymerase sigma factor [Bacillota bacterium]
MNNEFELISKAQQGDRHSFGELALLYRKNITGLAYRMLGDLAEAEDVTQDVFVKAYGAIGSFVPNREGSFKSWLLTITSRLCIDRQRRNYRLSFSSEIEPQQELALAGTVDSIAETVIRAETRRLVREAVLRLPPNYRMAVILKYLEGLEYHEIAKIMDVPIGTAGTWIRRGLLQLRNDLQTKGVFSDEQVAAR